jgi:DNA-binding response OmpR family regulator
MALAENLRFDQVQILLVDPAQAAREAVRNILRDHGFRMIHQADSLASIREFFKTGMPDLMICESTLADGDFCELMGQLRHHEIGDNPFLPVIALTWQPTPELVSRVVGAGVDDLLTKPISTGQLIDRIRGLIRGRKPFIVTSDYIGPDRRHLSERQSNVELLDVPNSLRSKAMGEQEGTDIQGAIDTAFREVNVQKLERYVVQIAFLIDQVEPTLKSGKMDDTTSAFLDRLLEVAEDTGRRLIGTKYEHVSELCQSLQKVARSICAAKNQPSERDIRLLRPLSQAIQSGFEATGSQADAARVISSEVGR